MLRCLVLLAPLSLACGAPPTAVHALGLHQPPRMLAARDLGRVEGGDRLDLILSLRGPGPDVEAVLRSPNARILSPAEFGARFSPGAGEYARLIDWLTGHGLEVVTQTPSRTTLTVRGTVEAIERAFHTRLHRYQDRHGTFRAPAVEPRFDAELSAITAVLGLDDSVRHHPFLHAPPGFPAAVPGSQDPAALRALYGADQVPQYQGEGETIAILSAGYLPSPARDVDSFIEKFALPTDRPAQYTQLFLGGRNRDPERMAIAEYGENVLDICAAMGIAPKASFIHVAAATVEGLFSDALVYAVNNLPHAHAVSVSWGACERGPASVEIVYAALFQQAKAQGQQWFWPTGDDGTDACRDGDPGGVLSTIWPAADPSVIAVGGTGIANGQEVAWDHGGGGQSEWIAKPPYQIGVGPYPADGRRDQPDVAAAADPITSPTTVVFNGQVTAIGGTSAAVPIWAALWVLLDQATGGQGIRDGHERLYQLGAAAQGFHDVITGANNGVTPGFPALPGYDLATGWGSPDLPGLIAHW